MSPYLIVVVEDNPSDRYLLEESLRTHKISYELVSLKSGEEFIEYSREVCDETPARKPDLVVLDWTLPKTSGSELIREVRLSARCAEAPILVLTSSISPLDRQAAFDAGVTCFLTKPTALDEYLAIGKTIRLLLEGGTHQMQFSQYR